MPNDTVMAHNDGGAEAIDRKAITMSLRAILATSEFERHAAASAFLRYVVEETLAGRGHRLKAFSIATQALGRHDDFDPQANSLVRVQAMRLREMLAIHYAGPGAADPIRIVLPRGSYQPKFEHVDATRPQVEIAPKIFTRPSLYQTLLWSAGGGVLLVAWLFLQLAHTTRAPTRPTLDGPPSVALSLPDPGGLDPASAEFVDKLGGAIERGLSAYDYLTVRPLGPVAPPHSADYALRIALLRAADGKLDLSFALVHAATGGMIWSLARNGVDDADPSQLREVEDAIVRTVGDSGGGAIFADLRARYSLFEPALNSYTCSLAADVYVRERPYGMRKRVRDCLEATIESEPDNVGALTSLATVLIVDELNVLPGNRGKADVQRALLLARHAYDLAPQRASAETALFFARFYDKRFEDAFEVARRAIEANPDATLMMARIARGYVTRGHYEEGVRLLAPILEGPSGEPVSMVAVVALAAYMAGDDERAYRYITRGASEASALGLVMSIVVCHRHGDAACASQAKVKLERDFPGFAADIPAAFDRHALSEVIKLRLLADLADAGLPVAPRP